ncbi:RNA polymerase sigma factor [Seongchinamella unica]|uniref:RNA polymerase sigma factor n=1 Tax=Seongchinamella unica TaxID=2547392 RepID=A0A4R5LWS0_9GAMM|nr:RNA polymerase sigma factor [Seongchinamella unica]TDG15939.1 RNA polymerase sigma factor [Seongchinamella unica]
MEKLYRQWIDKHQDQVWSLALYLMRDRAEAEDICQEAFTRLWQHRDTMNDGKAGPWLKRVTRNLCLDRLRGRRDEIAAGENDLFDELNPESVFEQGNRTQRLQELVAALKEPYRSLVVLRDIQQHSYRQVAEITGLSQPQVKTYLHRARHALRKQWSEHDDE